MFESHLQFILETAIQISVFQCTRRTHTKWWVWLRALWRVAWLALNQAGRCLGAQQEPVIITCEWLPVSLGSKTEASETSDEHREVGMLTATEVLVCFGLLLITVWHGGKATSSVKPLSGQLAGGDTYCSPVWLPSGRTWALKTGVHSASTPAQTQGCMIKASRKSSKNGERSKKEILTSQHSQINISGILIH